MNPSSGFSYFEQATRQPIARSIARLLGCPAALTRLYAVDGEPGAQVAKQAETVRRSYEHAVTNMKELAVMIQHADADAMEVLNKRFIEAMEEVRSLAQIGRTG